MHGRNPLVRTVLSYLLLTLVVLSAALPGSSNRAIAAPQLDNNEEIVYLTNDGQIQVLDTLQTGGATKVQWNSGDDKGYFDFTLGDVNNDGDKEIIGIKDNGNAGLLIIYDPVVNNGPSDGSINGVPWRRLVTIDLLGKPSVVAAGDFDTGVSGDEILVVYAITGGSRLEVRHGTTTTHDGTSWEKFVPGNGQANIDFGHVWRDASVGDVIAGGPQEVLLSASDTNIFRIYRFDSGFAGLCDRTDLDINDVAVGQWNAGGGAEIGVVRSFNGDSTFQFNRFLMFSCNTGSGKVDDVNIGDTRFRDAFAVSASDVNGNGDDEFFLLRALPNEQATTGAHLLGRNGGGDSLDFEVNLGGNFYQSITGGDVDGDGKDEVVIMRDNNIRVYTDPEIGADAKNRWVDYSLTTNQFAVEVGDVDKNGFAAGYLLVSDKSSLSATVSAGDGLVDAGIFIVGLNTDTLNKQHNEPIVEGMPAGVNFSFRTIGDQNPGFTPSTYIFNIDATGATTPQPNSPYVGNIVISSNDAEVKNVLRIPFALTLTYARLETTPASIVLSYYPCNDSSTQVQNFANQIKIDGTPGVTFQVIGGSSVGAASTDLLPKWLGISPESGQVGDYLSFSVDPTQWSPKQYAEATVILQGDAKTGSQLKEFKVGVICAKSLVHLPIVTR